MRRGKNQILAIPAFLDPGVRGGFTLIELLTVMAIIAILAALALPVISGDKDKAQQTVCLNNLNQITRAMQMYCNDSADILPGTQGASNGSDWGACWNNHRALWGGYVGLTGTPSPQDKLFACPADTFYVEPTPNVLGTIQSPVMVHVSLCAQTNLAYASYGFNEGMANEFYLFTNTIGIGGRKASSIKAPAKTVLLTEAPAFAPYSWHQPANGSTPDAVHFSAGGVLFSDARDIVSFVDGHVKYSKIYWNPSPIQPGTWSISFQYDPPAEYDYQWGDK
ncbi:MAG: type II secretion system protein [Limisphaerales bacterium]